ncbi:unnamed protein product [Pleuronectes platessa]|uniref:Uncharacterized protein n=1 Tax=Pleuronectes platessa TaxID=8262 RepID=A0A9N7TJT7_PLEPL|nr:unnamed protein product [Pleuronectes platessa]
MRWETAPNWSGLSLLVVRRCYLPLSHMDGRGKPTDIFSEEGGGMEYRKRRKWWSGGGDVENQGLLPFLGVKPLGVEGESEVDAVSGCFKKAQLYHVRGVGRVRVFCNKKQCGRMTYFCHCPVLRDALQQFKFRGTLASL